MNDDIIPSPYLFSLTPFIINFDQDKVTLKMFAFLIETGKLERALDLVHRLHFEKSFDIAMTIADKHRKLVSLIEQVKGRKFPEVVDEEEDEYIDDESVIRTTEIDDRKRISPDSSQRIHPHIDQQSLNRRVKHKYV
jgi:hypothetical protein